MKHVDEYLSTEKEMYDFYTVKASKTTLIVFLFHMKLFGIFKEILRFLPDGKHLQEISAIYQTWNLK